MLEISKILRVYMGAIIAQATTFCYGEMPSQVQQDEIVAPEELANFVLVFCGLRMEK